MHTVIALYIAPAALHAAFSIFYPVNCKKIFATLPEALATKMIQILYEPCNENVVSCKAPLYDYVEGEDYNRTDLLSCICIVCCLELYITPTDLELFEILKS